MKRIVSLVADCVADVAGSWKLWLVSLAETQGPASVHRRVMKIVIKTQGPVSLLLPVFGRRHAELLPEAFAEVG